MSDLHRLKSQIEQLTPEEIHELSDFMDSMQRIRPAVQKDPELRLTALREALEKFREGISDAEMKRIAEFINVKPAHIKDLARWDWLEDER
jgi:hypothetical protein